MPDHDEYGIPIKQKTSTESVDEFGIPIRKKQPSFNVNDVMSKYGLSGGKTSQQELVEYGQEVTKATKEKQEKDKEEAVTNTAKLYFENNPSLLKSYSLSNKKATGDKFSLTQLRNSTPFQQKVAELKKGLNENALVPYTDNTGQKKLGRNMGGWGTFVKGINDVWNANEEIDKWENMSDADRIKKYKEFVADKEYLPEKPDVESLAYAGGQALPTVGKIVTAGTIGAGLEAIAPETLGVSLTGLPAVMAWAALVPDMAKHNQMQSERDAFKNIKESNPNISDEEALKLAKEAGVIGYAKGLGVGTAMQFIGQGSLPVNSGQGLLKATGQFLKNQPQSIAEIGALDVGSSYAEEGLKRLVGVKDENFAETAGKMLNSDAIMQLAFNIGHGIVTAPKYVKAQSNEVLSKIDSQDLQLMQQRAVEEGLITEQQVNDANKSLQEYKAAKAKMPPLDSEEKTAVIAGLIQKKQNLERLKTESDKSFHDEIDAQIEAADQRIQLAKKSNDPIKYAEQDDIDGAKNFNTKPFEDLSNKEIEGIIIPKEYGEVDVKEIGEGENKTYKPIATVIRKEGALEISDKIPIEGEGKVYKSKEQAQKAADKALAEHYYNNAMDETLKPEQKSSVTVIRPYENKSPEIIENVKVEEIKEPIQQTMEGGRTSDELISTKEGSVAEAKVPENVVTEERPEIVEIKQERKGKIKQLMKDNSKIEFIPSRELVKAKDPVSTKLKHDAIISKYKSLRKLIDCL